MVRQTYDYRTMITIDGRLLPAPLPPKGVRRMRIALLRCLIVLGYLPNAAMAWLVDGRAGLAANHRLVREWLADLRGEVR